MAQKEIAIKLGFSSTGEQKVIKNLAQLEQELATLQNQLKTLDFGTPAFVEATQNIAKLRSAIDDVDKATEGIGAEKRFRAIGDAVSVLTGSFQVLSGALGLLITDEEDLVEVQKAEAAALQVLNIALGINAINTALVESATLRAGLATKAWNAITKTATAVQQAFNAALKANPIGLIVTSVLALTAAVYGLITAYKSLTAPLDTNKAILEETEKIEQDLIATRGKASADLERQLRILTDNVETRELELKTIEELKKAYPGLNAFIDRNNKLTEKGITFINATIALRKAEAAAAQVATAQVEEEIRLEQEIARIRDDKGFTSQAAKLIDIERERTQVRLDALRNVETKYTQEIEKQLELLKPLQKELDNQAKAEEKAAKATGENVVVIDKVLKQYEARIAGLKQLISQLQQAQNAELKYTAGIIENQEKALGEQEDFLITLGENLSTESQKVLLELRDFLFKTIPSAEEAEKLSDGYSKIFSVIGDAIKSGELDFKEATGWEEFVDFAETKLPGIGESLTNVNEESRRSFVQYFNSLDERVKAISGSLSEGLTRFFGGEATPELLNSLVSAEGKIAQLRADAVKLGLTENDLRKQSLDIIDEEFGISKKVRDEIVEQTKLIINLEAAERAGDKKTADALRSRLEASQSLVGEYRNLSTAILDGAIKTDEFVKGLKAVEEQSGKNLQKIEENKTAIQQAYDPRSLFEYGKALKENADILLLDLAQNAEQYLERFGQVGVESLLAGIEAGLPELENATRDELNKLIGTLETLGGEIQRALGLAANPFQDAIDRAKKQLNDLPSELSENFQSFFSDLDKIVSSIVSKFQTITNGLSQVLQSRNSLVLEQLARDEEETLARIGNASTRALKEQEAARLDFAKKRFEIEKKARIQELNFTLAQTIAEGAQAVVNALANVPFPASIPFATLVTGLAVAQTQAVANQLTFVKSQQFVGRRGGLILGESHEGNNGGVPALLEGGEFVVNKAAVAQYGDLIGELNASTGGRKLTIDDSRLVQAIAKQNQTAPPIKTYVLFNDIQNTEKLNNKITSLSRL
jgi:hypothetical protein